MLWRRGTNQTQGKAAADRVVKKDNSSAKGKRRHSTGPSEKWVCIAAEIYTKTPSSKTTAPDFVQQTPAADTCIEQGVMSEIKFCGHASFSYSEQLDCGSSTSVSHGVEKTISDCTTIVCNQNAQGNCDPYINSFKYSCP